MDYKYEPEEDTEVDCEPINEREDSIDDFETSIQELDKLERTTENITMNPDTHAQHFPDILKNPLYVKTIPERPPEIIPKNSSKEEVYNKYSIVGFLKFIFMTYIGVIEDLFVLDDITVDSIRIIFTKNNRLSALGISFIFIYAIYLFLK
jgi:hypothetical protein